MCRCYLLSSPALPVLATDVLFWAALAWSLTEAAGELRARHPWWPAVPAGLAAPALVALCVKVAYVRAQLYRPWYVDAMWNARVSIVPLFGVLANTFTLAAWLFSLPYYVGELAADGVGVPSGAPHALDTDIAAATGALMRRPSSILLCAAYVLTLCCACVASAAHRRVLVAQLEAIDSVPLLDVGGDDNDAYGGSLSGAYDQPTFFGSRPSAPREAPSRTELARAFVPEKPKFVDIEMDSSVDDASSVPLPDRDLHVDNSRAASRAPLPPRLEPAWRIDGAGDETSDAAVTSDAPLDSPRRHRRRNRSLRTKKKKAN